MHGGVVYHKNDENSASAKSQEGIPMPMSETAMHHFKSLEDYKRHKKEEKETRKIEKSELNESDSKSKSHAEKQAEREERQRLHEEDKLERERLKKIKKAKNREANRELAFEQNFRAPNLGDDYKF